MPAVAVTDHGNMFGAFAFYHEAVKQGVRPIIGVEAYIAPADRRDREAQAASESGEGYAYHLTILAATQTGYKNLVRLVSEAYMTGFYHRPRMDKALLREHAEGPDRPLRAASRARSPGRSPRGNYGAAKKAFLEYEEIFGKGNFYVEIMDHGLPQQTAIVPDLLRLSTETGAPAVATNDSHYLRRDDAFRARGPPLHRHGQDARGRAPDALLQRRVLRQEPRRDESALRALVGGGSCATRSPSPSGAPCPSTRKGCTFRPSRRRLARRRPSTSGSSPAKASSAPGEMAADGRGAGIAPEKYRERLDYEIGVIEKMGFPSYFLIVSDFIRYAREKGISVGPGPRQRGRIHRGLGAPDHGDRPAAVRPALRALPEPRAHLDAGHRHRLLPGPARRGHRVRHEEVRPRERRADRDVLAAEAEARGARRRPRALAAGRARRPDRQARARRAGRQLRAGVSRVAGPEGSDGLGRVGRQGRADRGTARGACRATPECTRRASSSLPSRSPSTCRSTGRTRTKSRPSST